MSALKELRVKRKSVLISSVEAFETSLELDAVFSRYGEVDMITFNGCRAVLVFKNEASVDAVLALCKPFCPAQPYPPRTWLHFRDDGRLRVKLPVPRPPPLGPFATRFVSEDERWRLHEAFLAAGERADGPAAEALTRKLLPGTLVPSSEELGQLFAAVLEPNTHDQRVDFHEFLEFIGSVLAKSALSTRAPSTPFAPSAKRSARDGADSAMISELTPPPLGSGPYTYVDDGLVCPRYAFVRTGTPSRGPLFSRTGLLSGRASQSARSAKN